MYAQMCLRLSEEAPNFDDPGKTGNSTFRRLLLKQCEEEFNNRSKASQAFDKKDGPLTLEEEEQRSNDKRKMLGNIKFIGELAKLDMLHETILHKCIKQLLDKKRRASVADTSEDMECLCHLMRTVGPRIDVIRAKPLMDQYFDRMRQILQRGDLPSRIKFMLEDTVALRNNKWIPRKSAREAGPKMIHQIRQEAWQDHSYPATSGSHHPVSHRNSPPHHPGKWFGPLHAGQRPVVSRGLEQPMSRGLGDVFVMDNGHNIPGPRYDEFGPGPGADRVGYGMSFVEEFDSFTVKDPWSNLSARAINNSSPPAIQNMGLPSRPQQQYGVRRPPSKLSSDGEISLRPAKDSIAAKAPGFVGRAQSPSANKKDPLGKSVAPPIIEKSKPQKKTVGPSNTDLENQTGKMLVEYLSSGDLGCAVNTIRDMKAPKFMKKLVIKLFIQSHDKSEEEREKINQLMMELFKQGVLMADDFVKGLETVLEQCEELKQNSPEVKQCNSTTTAHAITQGILSLNELSKLTENGRFYPMFIVCLKQLENMKGEGWLTKAYTDSKANFMSTLPESDKSTGRMMEILQRESLMFLFPLLRTQSDLYKKIQEDTSVSSLYKWIKDNVDGSLHTSPAFINTLTTCILRYATKDSTLAEGVDTTQNPDKELVEKERAAMKKLQPLLEKFLHERVELQVSALYSLQVFCHNNSFPKGLLLRMFMLLYDMEVIEEEAFVKWKEDVNDEHPGKGKSLFQVNSWLTWLETADEEGSESEPE